ncbi:MAG: hypothetical protein R6U27_16445 [Desulfobacterales bacterium]
MKSFKAAIILAGCLCIVFGLVSPLFAGGSPAPGDEGCVVENPGGGADKMKGTMAVVYDEDDNHSTDVTLRLERSGEQKFFRLNLSGMPLHGLTTEGIVCRILNPKETPNEDIQARVTGFVNEILTAFFQGRDAENTRLVITMDSISDCQKVVDCVDEESSPVHCLIPGTNRTSSLGDIDIYAVETVETSKVK